MALTAVQNGQLSDASQLNQVINAITGQTNNALTFAQNSTTNYAVTIRNQGGLGLGLKVQGSTGGNLLLVNDAGVTFGGSVAFTPTLQISSITDGSSASLLTFLGSTASRVIPASVSVTYNPTTLSPIKSVITSALTDTIGTGGHLTAIAGITQVDSNGGFGTAGDHHFGGVFICRAGGNHGAGNPNMRTSTGGLIENGISGILAKGEVYTGYNCTVRGANIIAQVEQDVTGTATLSGIELNIQHGQGTIIADRYGLAIGSVAYPNPTYGLGTITGNNAAMMVVTKSTNAIPWQDVILLASGTSTSGPTPNTLNSSGSLIRDASNSPMKYLADVSGSSFGVANAGLFNLPASVTQTTIGSTGGATAIPGLTPEGYIKMRVNSSNVVVPYWKAA